MATIYLSSTYDDLSEQRKAVYDALRRMRHDVVAMEDYGAADDRPVDKCLNDVAACDLYVGIFAWRYEFIPAKNNPSKKSITELEYRKASELGKPCLIFLLAENVSWPLPKTDLKTGEGEKGAYIESLRNELTRERSVNFFHSTEELATRASNAVTNCLKDIDKDTIDIALMTRISYLESVYEHYKSVKLPIGPADGLSLEAIFQPLTLRRDPLAADDLEREKRRKLLGEPDEPQSHRFMTSFNSSSQGTTAENGEDALRKSPRKRVVVLGGPGTGKTTTLKHLVALRAKEALDNPDNPTLPIFISLTDLANSGKGLQSYLTQLVDYLKVDNAFAKELWQAIEDGKAFLCLDGLEEVTPALRSNTIDLINTWTSDTRNTWIIGSRFTEYKNGQFNRGQFSEWELQPMSASVRRELARRLIPMLQNQLPETLHSSLTPEIFVDLLEKHPQAIAWGDNPLLFSLAAVVFVKTGDLPSSRVALYHTVVEAILKLREQDAMKCELLLRVFTKLALWLHQTKGRTFTRSHLIIFLEDVQKRSVEDTATIANRIVMSGLVEVVARDTYGFRHLTFQEYLAAAALAIRFTSPDPSIRKDAWHLAESKRTYSRWTEILRLLVGILSQHSGPEGKRQAQRWLHTLVEQRSTPEGDPGNLGLLLALKSLSEVTEPLDEMSDTNVIAEKIVLIWLEELLKALRSKRYARHQPKRYARHQPKRYARQQRFENLAYEVSHLRKQTLNVIQKRLVEDLTAPDISMRVIALNVCGLLEEIVPVETLIGMLGDVNRSVRIAAVEALGKQGERVPLEVLVGMLKDEGWYVRSAVVEALGEQGECVPVQIFIKALYDKEWDVRVAAARASGKQKRNVPLDLLIAALADENNNVRQAAVEVLNEIAPVSLAEVTEEALAILRGDAPGKILGSIQHYFVIDVIGDMNKVPPVLMDHLISLLDWPYWLVRVRAVEALGRIRRNIPDRAIQRLHAMHRDPDPNMYVLREAVDDALAEILSLEAGIEDD